MFNGDSISRIDSRLLLTYLDDVLVKGRSIEKHNQNLVKVFNRLCDARCRLKPSKCKLAQRSVEHLGHIASEEEVRMDPRSHRQ